MDKEHKKYNGQEKKKKKNRHNPSKDLPGPNVGHEENVIQLMLVSDPGSKSKYLVSVVMLPNTCSSIELEVVRALIIRFFFEVLVCYFSSYSDIAGFSQRAISGQFHTRAVGMWVTR